MSLERLEDTTNYLLNDYKTPKYDLAHEIKKQIAQECKQIERDDIAIATKTILDQIQRNNMSYSELSQKLNKELSKIDFDKSCLYKAPSDPPIQSEPVSLDDDQYSKS